MCVAGFLPFCAQSWRVISTANALEKLAKNWLNNLFKFFGGNAQAALYPIIIGWDAASWGDPAQAQKAVIRAVLGQR